MKETLHSRHHSTVLPRLGSNRMESHQNLHTHAVYSAIQLQGNNRVLKKRPPPISDEEQGLNRRQRCTLSQLRSGHCHLFACTTHPTDLSPEDLLPNPVRSICAFSYLDNGHLDLLEEGPGLGKQQQQADTDRMSELTIKQYTIHFFSNVRTAHLQQRWERKKINQELLC